MLNISKERNDPMQEMKPLGPLLGYCAHLFRERLDARLAQDDVTPAQVRVIHYLYHQGGSAPQCEVTAHLKVKPSTANGILDRMEEKGLLRFWTIKDSAGPEAALEDCNAKYYRADGVRQIHNNESEWHFEEYGDDCKYSFYILPEDLIPLAEFAHND
jgi:hypothetical protein